MPPEAPVFDFGIGFKNFGERIAGHRERRKAIGEGALSFGVSFLDRALGGIFPNDLVLIGAKSGVGKTQLATLVAMWNAYRGKRVHYLALEAEDSEIEYRMLYRLVVDIMWQAGVDDMDAVNYLDWYAGRLDARMAEYERKAEPALREAFKTLHTFYRVRDFTGEQMERLLLAIQDQTDLIILDHLHYVDSDDPNENRGYKAIVKKIRDTALNIGKPVIVVAHVRKAERGRAQGVLLPSLDDFHGSSDVPKIATKALMLARAPAASARHLSPTYMAALKCRQDGQRTRHVALCSFDYRKNGYETDFVLGSPKLGKDGEVFEPINVRDWPEWAHADPFRRTA